MLWRSEPTWAHSVHTLGWLESLFLYSVIVHLYEWCQTEHETISQSGKMGLNLWCWPSQLTFFSCVFTHHSAHFTLLSLVRFLRLRSVNKLHTHWWKCCTSGRKPAESGHSARGSPSPSKQERRQRSLLAGHSWRTHHTSWQGWKISSRWIVFQTITGW